MTVWRWRRGAGGEAAWARRARRRSGSYCVRGVAVRRVRGRAAVRSGGSGRGGRERAAAKNGGLAMGWAWTAQSWAWRDGRRQQRGVSWAAGARKDDPEAAEVAPADGAPPAQARSTATQHHQDLHPQRDLHPPTTRPAPTPPTTQHRTPRPWPPRRPRWPPRPPPTRRQSPPTPPCARPSSAPGGTHTSPPPNTLPH